MNTDLNGIYIYIYIYMDRSEVGLSLLCCCSCTDRLEEEDPRLRKCRWMDLVFK